MDRDQTSWILRLIAAVAVVVLLSATLAARGLAVEWRGHREGGWHGHDVPHWGHSEIARFHEWDLHRWRSGHWQSVGVRGREAGVQAWETSP
jgi:hypothetical protein